MAMKNKFRVKFPWTWKYIFNQNDLEKQSIKYVYRPSDDSDFLFIPQFKRFISVETFKRGSTILL